MPATKQRKSAAERSVPQASMAHRVPAARDPAVVGELVPKIRALAEPVVAEGPHSTPDTRYEAYFLAAYLVAHPESAVIAHQKLHAEVTWVLRECGYIDDPNAQVLGLLKELVEQGFGTHVFQDGAWRSLRAFPGDDPDPRRPQ